VAAQTSTETRPAHLRLTFAVLASAVAAFALLQSLVVPVLGTIAVDLHTDQNTITWVLTAYLLSASIFTPIMGRVGDMVGKKKIFVVTLVALAVGSLLAAVATGVGVLIVARVIQGVGGGVLPLAFGIIRDEFPPERVQGAIGLIASLTAVGAGLGIVLAGPIVDLLDYHWLFWLPMILTVVAAAAAHRFVPESTGRTPGRVSWLPAVILSAWLVGLLLALSKAPAWGWLSGRVLGLLAGAAVLAVAWVEVERRSATPLIDMRMMRRPAVWTNNLVALLIGSGMYAVFAFVPQFVQTPATAGYGFGASITESGLMLLPSTLTMFAAGIYAGRLADRIGARSVVILGCLVGIVAMALFAFAHEQKWELYLANAVLGLGFGLVFAAMSGLIVNAVPREQTGVASGMNANIRTIGGSVGAALMASIVTADPGPGGLPREAGYTHGFTLLAGALTVAALAALLIPRTPRVLPVDEPEHAQLGLVAAGTLVGDEPE
jgi:EmrB/QacA subfamily drug resistance transporter